jgi:hypothetical protein
VITPAFVSYLCQNVLHGLEASMLVLYVIVNAVVLLVIPLLPALFFVMFVAPVRWFTLSPYVKLLLQLLVALVLWVLLIAVCFLYSFIRPSELAMVGLGLLVLWYFYIPFFFAVVSIAWFSTEKVAAQRRARTGHV